MTTIIECLQFNYKSFLIDKLINASVLTNKSTGSNIKFNL